MTHRMSLRKAPFDAIRAGQKTVELRLYDEKRKQLAPGDRIEFTNTEDPRRVLLCRVTHLHVFATFEDLYRTLSLLSCGYTEETVGSASPHDMDAYYPKEEQEKYEVVGIELTLVREEPDYDALKEQLRALTEGVPHRVANLANASALLYGALSELNWLGFYLLDGDSLILGPFQGKPACIEIPVGRGVCGTAVLRNETVVVPDVHAFAGHIACDGASRSEIVIPLRKNGRVLGVLDVDSPIPDRFSDRDAEGLTHVAELLSELL